MLTDTTRNPTDKRIMDMNKQDWTKAIIRNEDFIGMTCDITDWVLQETYNDKITQEDANGDTRYTDDAQDQFNHLLDHVQTIVQQWVNIQEDEAVKISEAQI